MARFVLSHWPWLCYICQHCLKSWIIVKMCGYSSERMTAQSLAWSCMNHTNISICYQVVVMVQSKYGTWCKWYRHGYLGLRLLSRWYECCRDGKYVVSFTVHALGVKSFIEPAEQNDTRIRGCVVSVAKDNSVALISVDSMTWYVLYRSIYSSFMY